MLETTEQPVREPAPAPLSAAETDIAVEIATFINTGHLITRNRAVVDRVKRMMRAQGRKVHVEARMVMEWDLAAEETGEKEKKS